MANVRYGQHTAASSAAGNDVVPFETSGGQTRRITINNLFTGRTISNATITSLTAPLSVANGGTGGASASAARTGLGLVIGTNVQAYHANLSQFAGLTLVADRLPYANGSGTLALATFTSAGRALVDDADAAAQRVTLGLGGASISDDFLTRLCLGRQYTLSSITRSSGLVTGGSGTFADGSALTYTVTRSSGLVATEVFAHAGSGKTLTITYSRTSGLVSSYAVAIT